MHFDWFNTVHHKYAQYKQKGFAPILVLVGIVIIIGIAAGAYYFGKSQPPKTQTQNQVVVSQTPQPTIVPSSIPVTSPAPTTKLTDSSKTVTIPYALVDTSGWQKKTLPKLKISLAIPSEWQVVSETDNAVSFEMGSTRLSFLIILDQNTRNYGRRDFIWNQTLGMTIDLAEAIKQGLVGQPKEWLIDGVSSLSLHKLSTFPREASDHLVIPIGNQMIVISVYGREFSTNDPELFTVLSTIKISR